MNSCFNEDGMNRTVGAYNHMMVYLNMKGKKNIWKIQYNQYSGDLRQGSSNNSVTNFVQGFPYVFQREKQPSFEG